MTTPIDDIAKKVAKENNLNPILTEQLNRIQFKFLVETMGSGSMEGVSIIYLGKFIKNARYENKSKRDKSGILESNIQGG